MPRALRHSDRSTWPSLVRISLRRTRSNSVMPRSVSRSLIWRDSAGCAIPSCADAFETVPRSATVTNVRKCRKSMFWPHAETV